MRFFIFILLLTCSCSQEKKNTLHLFTWSGLFKPELIAAFEDKYQCQVVIDTYDSNESMYAKLKLSSAGYDLIFPSNYYLDLLYQQGIIVPLDPSKLDVLEGLDSQYFKREEPLLGLPFIVSFSGIAYRQDRIPYLEPTYGVFGKSSFKGRMTMLSDLREAMGAALKYLGYSINSIDPEEINQAADILIQWKQNLAKFESEQYKNGLASAEFLIVQGYSIDIMQLQQENETIHFLFPKEGAILSLDYISLTKNASQRELAYAFMNFMLEPTIAAANMHYINTLIPVKAAYNLLEDKMRKSPILFPSGEELGQMEMIEDLKQEIKLYYKAWERVKAS